MIDDLVESLSDYTGLMPSFIRKIATTAPRRYKLYTIAKRSGGVRIIAHPARELKLIQRAFLDVVLNRLPVHEAATAYRKGISLRDNAARHAGIGPVLKMDLRNFFPSIRGDDWVSYCHNRSIFQREEDVILSEKLLFRKGKHDKFLTLSIGAPSSPALSNILLHDLDAQIWNAVSDDFVTYTRYADDMTFSAPRAGYLRSVKATVAKIIRTTRYPKLDINDDKTKLITSKYHRSVTGLTLAQDGSVTVGQLKKRNIRAGIHRFMSDELSSEAMLSLMGNLAFLRSIEPGYYAAICEKHGGDLIAQIALRRRVTD